MQLCIWRDVFSFYTLSFHSHFICIHISHAAARTMWLQICGVCTKCVCVHIPVRFAGVKESALAYVCVCVCVQGVLMAAWLSAGCSPGCGLAGCQRVQLKTKEGGSAPSGCQAGCLTVRWSELVCYWVSAAQTGNSVSRQAGATGLRRRRSSAIRGAREAEFKSICILRKCSVTENVWDHFNSVASIALFKIFNCKIYDLHTD